MVLMAAVSISLSALEARLTPCCEAFSSRSRSLSFMFRAASLVKVITRNWEIDASGSRISVSLIFSTITVVFPEPAAAETRIFRFPAQMASVWEALNFVGTGVPLSACMLLAPRRIIVSDFRKNAKSFGIGRFRRCRFSAHFPLFFSAYFALPSRAFCFVFSVRFTGLFPAVML